jgi:RNA polymerase sigma-70 factor (ECF subfamily)
MDEAPPTRLTLLARLRDVQDEAAWGEFVDVYAPLVYNLARRHGLQDADAGDVTQEVLRAAVGTLPGFSLDPRRGSFRGWLFTVARNALRKNANARKRQPRSRGAGGAFEAWPAPDDDEARWNQEYRERLFAWAAARVRGRFRSATWHAFWQTAVEGRDTKEVAAELGLSPGAVYIARSRVLAGIRALIAELDAD